MANPTKMDDDWGTPMDWKSPYEDPIDTVDDLPWNKKPKVFNFPWQHAKPWVNWQFSVETCDWR